MQFCTTSRKSKFEKLNSSGHYAVADCTTIWRISIEGTGSVEIRSIEAVNYCAIDLLGRLRQIVALDCFEATDPSEQFCSDAVLLDCLERSRLGRRSLSTHPQNLTNCGVPIGTTSVPT